MLRPNLFSSAPPPTSAGRTRPERPANRTRPERPANRSLVLAVILTAQMMVVLDATIVNVALPHIQHSLRFSPDSLSWVLNAYVLTFGGLLLLGARCGDLVGRRRTFLAGIGVFVAGSFAGGVATSAWMLLAARAVQGAGGALAAPAALALLSTVFPEGPERIRAIGLYTTVSAAGGATGLVAGGLLTQWASWRWVMFVNVPIGLAVLVAGRIGLVETDRRRGRFDLAGAVSSTAGMSALVFGLVEAGSRGWADPVTIASLAAGAILLGAFLAVEQRAAEPVMPLRVLADRTRAAANSARALGYAGMYGMVFFLTQYLQDVQHHSALVTGVGFLPTPTSVFLSSQLTSKVLAGRFRARTLMLTGSIISGAGLLLLTQIQPTTGYPQLLVSLVLIGTGMGVSFVSLTTAALHGVAPADAGAASGLINVSQQLGAALGLAVLVTVFDTAAGGSRAVLAGRGFAVVFTAATVFSALAIVVIAVFVRPDPVAVVEPDLGVSDLVEAAA